VNIILLAASEAGDQRLDVPVQATAIGESHLQAVQAALPLLDARLRAEAVFEEQKCAARFQYPVHFPKRLADILDATQRKRADGAIEPAVVEREPFTFEDVLVNLDSRLLDAFLRQPVHSGVRIDRRELADALGVVRKVQAGAEADFENVPMSTGEQFSPMSGEQGLVQMEVTEAGEDYLRVEAHRRLLTCLAWVVLPCPSYPPADLIPCLVVLPSVVVWLE
jgi:hypothetical protein